MNNGNYHLLLSDKKLLSVVRLTSGGHFIGSQQFKIEAAPKDNKYEQMALLSDSEKRIYILNKAQRKESGKYQFKMEIHSKSGTEIVYITVIYYNTKTKTSMKDYPAMVAGDYLCWYLEKDVIYTLKVDSMEKSKLDFSQLEGEVSVSPCSLLYALHAMPSQVIDQAFLDKMRCHLQVSVDGKARIHNLQNEDHCTVN